MKPFSRFYRVSALVGVSALLWGCAAPEQSSQSQEAVSGAWAGASSFAGARVLGPWEHYTLPSKQPTRFSPQSLHGRSALKAHSTSSASMVRRKLRIEPEALGTLRFSWLVESLIPEADMSARESDDSPVRIVLAFDGDRSNFSMRNSMLNELTLALTGEPMPYATLIYSWCPTRESGNTILNPRTDRIRTLVVEGGNQALGRWKDYARDVRADYISAFGEPPGALLAVGVMTDSDNTGTQAVAWYGPIQLEPPR